VDTLPKAQEGRQVTQAEDVAGVFADTASVRAGLAAAGYLADDKIAGVVSLAARLGKPLLIEGPAGTGKTQLAKSVAMMADRPLIRLQCYEGIDESKALYEWDYRKQLLWIQAARGDETFSADAVGVLAEPRAARAVEHRGLHDERLRAALHRGRHLPDPERPARLHRAARLSPAPSCGLI